MGSAFFHEPLVAEGGSGLVLVRDIDFAALSEDTLLPFHGRCHVAYVPSHGVVLGLSKLARLTRMFAKRLQRQERLGAQLASALHRQLACEGVAVVLQARHLDMMAQQPPQPRTTACISGCFAEPGSPAFHVRGVCACCVGRGWVVGGCRGLQAELELPTLLPQPGSLNHTHRFSRTTITTLMLPQELLVLLDVAEHQLGPGQVMVLPSPPAARGTQQQPGWCATEPAAAPEAVVVVPPATPDVSEGCCSSDADASTSTATLPSSSNSRSGSESGFVAAEDELCTALTAVVAVGDACKRSDHSELQGVDGLSTRALQDPRLLRVHDMEAAVMTLHSGLAGELSAATTTCGTLVSGGTAVDVIDCCHIYTINAWGAQTSCCDTVGNALQPVCTRATWCLISHLPRTRTHYVAVYAM
jgi:hypothetical protein